MRASSRIRRNQTRIGSLFALSSVGSSAPSPLREAFDDQSRSRGARAISCRRLPSGVAGAKYGHRTKARAAIKRGKPSTDGRTSHARTDAGLAAAHAQDHRFRGDPTPGAAKSSRAPSKGRCIAPTIARSAIARSRSPSASRATAIRLGDRVATLAWNGYRHLEAWYAITGLGAIYHTVNPRLFPEQIAWIINHAEDRIVFDDLTFVPLLEALADKLPTVERYIVLTDAAHMPATRLNNAIAYEDWLAEVDGDFRWAEFDERTAAGLCYTSGTTGNPKGVLYSHRSNVLHSMAAPAANACRSAPTTRCLPIVPMFHANSWGLRFLLPDARRQDGDARRQARRRLGLRILETREGDHDGGGADRLADAAAISAQGEQEAHDAEARRHRRLGLSAGDDPRLRGRLRRRSAPRLGHDRNEPDRLDGLDQAVPAALPREEQLALKAKQGWAPFGVEMKIVDDENSELPWDGKRSAA